MSVRGTDVQVTKVLYNGRGEHVGKGRCSRVRCPGGLYRIADKVLDWASDVAGLVDGKTGSTTL